MSHATSKVYSRRPFEIGCSEISVCDIYTALPSFPNTYFSLAFRMRLCISSGHYPLEMNHSKIVAHDMKSRMRHAFENKFFDLAWSVACDIQGHRFENTAPGQVKNKVEIGILLSVFSLHQKFIVRFSIFLHFLTVFLVIK